jgi:lipopolysaccharide export system permease protein
MRLTRADRYLEREVWYALAGVLAILLLVVLGGLLTDVLNKIARGKVPPVLLLSQIGLRIPDALTLLLPLGSLLAVLMSYGRLYRDSEMAVLAASGYGPLQTLRPLLRIGFVLVAVQAALAFYIAPFGREIAAKMIVETQRSVAVAGLSSGRFVELPGGGGVLYVSRVSADQRSVDEIMLVREREGTRIVLTARKGTIEIDASSDEVTLRLDAGERVDGRPGEPGYRRIRFEQADIAFPRTQADSGDDPVHARGTRELWRADDLESNAELTRRLAQPLVLLMLLLLAPVMAQSAPRQPRYDKVVVAILLYVTYSNLVELARVWALTGTLPAWLGTWWVHVGFVAVVIIAWGRELLAWRRGRRALASMGVR